MMQPTLHVRSQRIADVLVDEREIEPFRIEMTATPAFGVGMLGIGLIRHDVQEALVSGYATDVFRWPSPRAIDAGAMLRSGIESEKPLDLDRVMPIVTEVVGVVEHGAVRKVAETNLSEIEDTRIILERVLGQKVDVAVAQAADPKFVEVIVPPVESGLKGEMQVFEGPGRRQDEPPPDLRVDLVERNAKLHGVDGFEHAMNEQDDPRAVKMVRSGPRETRVRRAYAMPSPSTGSAG